MTPKQGRWCFILVAASVVFHLLSYNIKYFLSNEAVRYWYWILNSLTHMSYTVSVTFFAKHYLKKNQYPELKILVLFLEDWIVLEAMDVYNQFRGHYNINPIPQWIVFAIVLIIQAIRFKKWKSTFTQNRI